MEVIIDFQEFKKPFNEFVLKELAISAMKKDKNDELLHKIIIFDEPFPKNELPYKYKKINGWLTKNYHGIEWDTVGDVEHADIPQLLEDILAGVTHIFVKGLEKKVWLQKIIGQSRDIVVTNLEDLGCPKLDDLVDDGKCWLHRHLQEGGVHNYRCAMTNVGLLKTWYTKYLSGCLEKSLKKFCETMDLTNMSTEEISFLPKFFLLEFARTSIDEVWYKLPEKYQKEPEIKQFRRCRQHWDPPVGDQLPELPPFAGDCQLCQYLK